MQTIINNAIDQINQGTEWILKNAKVEKKKSYKILVKERRTLKKIKSTNGTKASVALYGESQCGKSHLSSSLLSADGRPMQVVDRMNEVEYEFLTHLNPPGSGEATGLITRFTTQKQSDLTKEYPVHIRLMSLKDISLMLCEGYYRDYEQKEPFSGEEIKRFISSLKEKKTSKRQYYLCEDDIGEIEEYCIKFFKENVNTLVSDEVDYFSELSLIIEYLEERDVISAIEMLWNNESNLSSVFEQFFAACKMVNFEQDAYISFYDLDNSKGMSLLDVRQLNLEDKNTLSKVRYKNVQGEYMDTQINKNCLAAICSEVVLEVILPNDINNSKKGNIISTILNNVDILDFPGARARGGVFVISGNVPTLLRRGKVAYCFNKYSTERKINALLYCWQPDKFEAKPMQSVLSGWIDVSIGKNEEERASYLVGMDYPPLFFVGTKFNLHLRSKTDDRIDNPQALFNRWDKWFNEQLSRDIIGVPLVKNEDNKGDYYKWFDSWTQSNPNFDNIYLLRDFRYSTEIFDGWTEQTGVEIIRKPEIYEGFYERLRNSFLEYPFVKKHFKDAVSRWDEASEVNCDGSLPIARNLASIVEKIAAAVAAKNARDIKEAVGNVIVELKKFYYNTDTEESLKKALNSAARLQASLSIAFGRDPYYFGRFMKSVTITEYAVHEVFSDVFPNVTEAGNIGDYVYIYMRAPGIKPSNSFEDNLRILRTAYGFSNDEECRQYFENNLKIDLEDLFCRSEFGLRSPSQILAATLRIFWFDRWLREKQHDCLCNMLGEESFVEMVDMLHALFVKYEVERHIAQTIHNYVDKFGVDVKELSEMIADICAEMINKFVLNVGYDFYSKEEGVVDNLKEASTRHQINLCFKYADEECHSASNTHVAELMAKIDDREGIRQLLMNPNEHSIDELSAAIPGFRQSRRWSDLAKVGFVLTNDIPTYDVEANNRLGQIIDQCRTICK